MTPTQAFSDCGHCSSGPKAVADQSSARILAPISPPPANTESINCVLMRSMAESLDLASALSDVHNRIHLLSLVLRRIVVGKAADERRAGHRVPTKQQSSNSPCCRRQSDARIFACSFDPNQLHDCVVNCGWAEVASPCHTRRNLSSVLGSWGFTWTNSRPTRRSTVCAGNCLY